jgi:hypothetical protein
LVFTLLSLPAGLIFLLTTLFVFMVPSNLDNWMRENGSEMAWGVGLMVVPGCLGMLLGIWALQQIRAASGRLRGLARSLIGALTWPAILSLISLNSIAALLLRSVMPHGGEFGMRFALSAGLALVFCVMMVYLVWGWARQGSTTPGAARGWLVAGIAAVLLIFPSLLTGMITGQVQRAFAVARGSSASGEPTPLVSGTSAPAPVEGQPADNAGN